MQIGNLKKLIGCLVMGVGVVGCSDPAFNSAACRQAVVDEFKTADVQNLEGAKFKFVVRDPDNNIWYVETMSSQSTKVTAKTMLFKGNK